MYLLDTLGTRGDMCFPMLLVDAALDSTSLSNPRLRVHGEKGWNTLSLINAICFIPHPSRRTTMNQLLLSDALDPALFYSRIAPVFLCF